MKRVSTSLPPPRGPRMRGPSPSKASSKSRGNRSAARSSDNVAPFNDISPLPISATFGGHQADLLYCGVLGGKWWRNYLHVHSFVEVCHVYAGRGIFRINDQGQTLSRG